MKKIYTIPHLKVIQMSTEDVILTGSKDSFDVGMSDDPMNGSEALSNHKDLWGNEDIWK